MQAEHDADVAFADGLLVIRFDHQRERDSVRAERRLDDVGHIFLVRFGVEVFKRLAGMFAVLTQIEVGAVGDAPELAPAEGEEVLEIGGRLGVVRQLLLLVLAELEVFRLHAEGVEEVAAVALPVVEPFKVGAGLAEELQLHLLELADAEDEVAGSDLVAERLADLADAHGQLAAGGAHNALEVDENALRSLGAQIDLAGGVLGDARVGLEHQIELADAGEVLLAAGGADDVVLRDEGLVLLVGPAVGLDLFALGMGPVLDQLVRAETRLAGLAVHQRIVEGAHVAAGYPDLAVHQDRAVEPDVVLALLHELLPPGPLDVVLELDAQGAVVPGVGETAVDLAPRKNKAAVFAQRDQFIHCQFLAHC